MAPPLSPTDCVCRDYTRVPHALYLRDVIGSNILLSSAKIQNVLQDGLIIHGHEIESDRPLVCKELVAMIHSHYERLETPLLPTPLPSPELRHRWWIGW